MGAGTNGAFFGKGKQAFAQGDIQWKPTTGQTFAAHLVDLSDWTSECFTISGVADNGGGLCRVTTDSAHGLTTGDRVHIAGVVGATQANGTWFVTVVDTTNIDLDGSSTPSTYTADAEDYVIRLDEVEFVNEITAGAVDESQNFAINANFVSTLGALDADDLTWGSATGDPCQAIIIARDDTPGSGDQVIAIITEGSGLPVILNGSSVTSSWPSGSSKIAAL